MAACAQAPGSPSAEPALRGVERAEIVPTVIPAAPYELPEVVATDAPNSVTVSFDDALCPDAAETALDLPPVITASFTTDRVDIHLEVVTSCSGDNTDDPARMRTVRLELAEPINGREIKVATNLTDADAASGDHTS